MGHANRRTGWGIVAAAGFTGFAGLVFACSGTGPLYPGCLRLRLQRVRQGGVPGVDAVRHAHGGVRDGADLHLHGKRRIGDERTRTAPTTRTTRLRA